MSIHKARRYDERKPRDAASDFDLRRAWSVFARRQRKPEVTVPIVHPARHVWNDKMECENNNVNDLQTCTITHKFLFERLNYSLGKEYLSTISNLILESFMI